MENINYIDILKAHLELRILKNNSYSLRAFARDLGINPPHLSEVLSHKKGMSLKVASELANKLGLKDEEKEFFLLSVESKHARNQKNRCNARFKLQQMYEKIILKTNCQLL